MSEGLSEGSAPRDDNRLSMFLMAAFDNAQIHVAGVRGVLDKVRQDILIDRRGQLPRDYFPYLKALQDHTEQVENPVIRETLQSLSRELGSIALKTQKKTAAASPLARHFKATAYIDDRIERAVDPLLEIALREHKDHFPEIEL